MQDKYIIEEGYKFGELSRGRRYKRKNIESKRRELCSESGGENIVH